MNRENSDPYKQNLQEEEESYKQELGLKKMLYKYEHQNEQLKAQIKALTQRLADILAKKDEQPVEEEKPMDPADQYRLNLLKQEMKKLYSEIQRVNGEIKLNKEKINEFQELRCVELENKIKNEVKEIDNYRQKMQKYEKMQQMKGFAGQAFDLKNSSIRINAHSDKLKSIEHDMEQTRKSIRQLQKYRDEHDRFQNKRHIYAVNLSQQTRKIASIGKEVKPITTEQPGNKGIWNMDYTEQNYMKIKSELAELKKEKDRIIDSLKNQNIVLKKRFAQLSIQSEQLNKSIHLPQIDGPKTDRHISKAQSSKNKTAIIPKSINQSRVNSPPRLLNVGPKQFERSNDKNYSPKKLRKVEWESSQHRTNGIQWNDAHLRSPITGINFWFDSHLIGFQILHRMGESSQHIHLTSKVVSPIQYRLNGNDYLQNIVLWISENKIVGIELISKNGRNDGFGNRGKGRKFDFQIKDPEKPVFSFGKFRINNNVSQITKLGFEVI